MYSNERHHERHISKHDHKHSPRDLKVILGLNYSICPKTTAVKAIDEGVCTLIEYHCFLINLSLDEKIELKIVN